MMEIFIFLVKGCSRSVVRITLQSGASLSELLLYQYSYKYSSRTKSPDTLNQYQYQ